MKFRFIADHADTWPVRTTCRVLGVSASGTTPGGTGPTAPAPMPTVWL
ncbi:hypothetical protein [Roseomonas acroporae]